MTLRVTWVQPEDLVRHELWQAAAEGRDVSDAERRWVQAGGVLGPPRAGASPEHGTAEQRLLARELIDELDASAPEEAGSVSDEPSGWAAIRDAVAAGAPKDRPVPDDVADRIHAAWLGRAVGCVLGKPVEKVPREGIEAILRATGRWPLTRYFTAVGLPEQVTEQWPWNKASRGTSLEENLDGMPEDDDLNYTVLALRIVEQHGVNLTADDVAQAWLLDLPAGRTFTAERAAYRNLLDGITPPQSARVRNPYREWIGAQIRTDLYGWVRPGQPMAAAELAWRDASVSHTRNGLYGAMFVAAMASVAVCGAPVTEVLDAGAAVVPPHSRMARAVAFGRELASSGLPTTEAYAALEREFAGLHWVHALNNTALAAYALAASEGRFDDAVCRCVMGGWDTDSTGATVGAVAGAMAGLRGIDPRWTDPLHDRLASSIPGADGVSFTELAARTVVAMCVPGGAI